jgi:hypothetical protein
MSRVSDRRRVLAARSRMGALILAGLLIALMAVASSSAQAALPEVGRCVKVAVGTGTFKDGKCLTHETGTTGKWQWMPASVTENLTFEGSGSPPVLKTAGHETVECVVANTKGMFTGAKTASVEIEFQGCQNAKGEECASGTSENQIKTNPVEAELGFIQNVIVEGHFHVKVGLDLKAQPPTTALANYKCGTGGPSELPNAALEGSVIAADKPIDVMKTENKLIFHVKLNGTQDPESFQEGPKDTLSTTYMQNLETFGPFPSTLSIKEYSGKYSQPLEIKAIEK